MNINNLFPTPVVFFNLDRDITQEEKDFVLNQEYHSNTGNFTSYDKYVLRKKELSSIKNFINTSIKEYFETIVNPKKNNNITPFITQSWLNKTEEGGYHHKHSHPNSYISGIFYIKANKEKDKVNFYKNKYQQIAIPADSYNLWNSTSWWFPIESGQLVIFPSDLSHDVSIVDSLRISLSFNVFVKGKLGSEDACTTLHYTKEHNYPL